MPATVQTLPRDSAASRQARFKANMAAQGLVQCNVWVPAAALADLQLQAERLREFPHLTAGPLRDPVSGRLVSLS